MGSFWSDINSIDGMDTIIEHTNLYKLLDEKIQQTIIHCGMIELPFILSTNISDMVLDMVSSNNNNSLSYESNSYQMFSSGKYREKNHLLSILKSEHSLYFSSICEQLTTKYKCLFDKVHIFNSDSFGDIQMLFSAPKHNNFIEQFWLRHDTKIFFNALIESKKQIKNLRQVFELKQNQHNRFEHIKSIKMYVKIDLYVFESLNQWMTRNYNIQFQELESSQIENRKYVDCFSFNYQFFKNKAHINLIEQIGEAYAEYIRIKSAF